MYPKKLLTAALVTSSLFLAGTVYAATVLTLNPSSTNMPAGPVIDAAHGAFNTDNIHGQLTSLLQINALAGATTWSEAGTILIDDFLLSNVSQNSGVYRSGGGNYDLYATFTGSGTGAWFGNTFVVGAGGISLAVNLYASPALGTPQVIATPGSSTTMGSGVTLGDSDFLLATASFLSDGTEFASATRAGTKGSTSLTANLNFFPAIGTEGSGFFQAPVPFTINLGSSSSTNGNETLYTTSGTTAFFTTPESTTGTSNLTPITVPEPGALSLVGLALVGLGFVARKRKADATV